MGRKVRAVVAAAFVLIAGARAAQAAPIGTFSLVDLGFGTADMDISNDSFDLTFTDVEVVFCFGDVVPTTSGGFLSLDGSARDCSGPTQSLSLFGDVDPGSGQQLFQGDFPLWNDEPASFAFLRMTVLGSDPAVVPYFVDPLDLGCDPFAGDCTNFIHTTPVPEPATMLLLAAGLASIAARRARWRS
jgi:hypothetical protein